MDFKKVPTLDPIVKQHTPSYTVAKGCLSVSSVKFSSLTSSSSSASFNLQVPSLNVFMDRKVPWTSEVILKCTLTHGDFDGAANPGAGGNPAADRIITAILGQDLAPNSFPAHRLVNTATATINDTVSTINMTDVMNEIITLNDLRPDQEANHTCPSYISRYADYKDGYGAVNSSLTGFYDQIGFKPTNGSYHDYSFCTENGSDIGPGDQDVTIDGKAYKFVNGVPVVTPDGHAIAGGAATVRTVYKFLLRIRTTEYLMLPPFVYNYDKLDSTGIFGVNNAQITLNFRPNPENVLQFIRRKLRGAGNVNNVSLAVGYHNLPTGSPFLRNELNVMFCTPPLDLKLPEISVVPFTNFSRFSTAIPAGFDAAQNNITVRSNTITLPSVPDCLIIAVKRQAYNVTQNEHYFPIQRLQITFDNFSALSASFTQEQLYQLSYRNGMHMDWNTWKGYARVPSDNNSTRIIQTVGGFVILRMGIDIPLSTGQAAGVNGNYTLSVEAQVEKPKALQGQAVPNLKMMVITPQSGFFSTRDGQSQILLNPLQESDVLDAKSNGSMSTGDYESIAYGGGFFDNLASSASKYAHMIGDAGKKAVGVAENIVSNPAVQQAAARIGEKVLTKKLGGGTRGSMGGGKNKTALYRLRT